MVVAYLFFCMILYFDSYITDIPFSKNPSPIAMDSPRNTDTVYHKESKLQVAKYTLASYAIFPWSHVLIRYKIDDEREANEFEEYVKKLFPEAVILSERSDTQEEYKKSLKIIEEFNDPWIFYSPNNDHPLMISREEDIEYIHSLLNIGTYWKQTYQFVSIVYSHFSEYVAAPFKKSANHRYFGRDMRLIEEDESAIVAIRENGDFNSVQIVHFDLFRHWFTSKDLTGRRVVRAEDLLGVEVKNHILIIPKRPICAHFDGYEHMRNTVNEILPDFVPPLFIPPGFFDSAIRIAYGYEENKKEYTNINPAAKQYSFRDSRRGTDLKIGLNDIPLFWHTRISEMNINNQANPTLLEKGINKNIDIMKNPWSWKSQGTSLYALKFHIRLWGTRFGLNNIAKMILKKNTN